MTAGSLLSVPMSSSVRAEVKFDRRVLGSYKDLSEGFVLGGNRDYERQYFRIYNLRLKGLKPLVESRVRKEGNSALRIRTLRDLSDLEEEVVILGTLFKHQTRKPNILHNLEGPTKESLDEEEDYTDPSDRLVLEDEDQRIELCGECPSFKVESLVTGIVCGIRGFQKGGKFLVSEVYFPDIPLPRLVSLSSDSYIAFVASPRISLENPNIAECLQLAVDWITGYEGCPEDQEKNSHIARVILIGDLLQKNRKSEDSDLLENVRVLEEFLLQLAKSIEVDVIPGWEDELSNASLPQQPVHKCLFPRVSPYTSTFRTVTNPYFFEIEGMKIYGSSGKNVRDVAVNSSLEDPLDCMESLLKWGHIAPTCPDTLGCFPYNEKDPFILDAVPHVFFSATSGEKHRRREKNGTLLLNLPSFSKGQSIVLLNLKDLTTKEIKFSFS